MIAARPVILRQSICVFDHHPGTTDETEAALREAMAHALDACAAAILSGRVDIGETGKIRVKVLGAELFLPPAYNPGTGGGFALKLSASESSPGGFVMANLELRFPTPEIVRLRRIIAPAASLFHRRNTVTDGLNVSHTAQFSDLSSHQKMALLERYPSMAASA